MVIHYAAMSSRIAISIGDPTGIGPEIVLKSLLHPEEDLEYQVYGDRALLERTAESLGLAWPTRGVEWHDVQVGDSSSLVPGRPHALAGKLQVESLSRALDAVLEGRADALCTAPITKAAAHDAGFSFPGHTEYLAHRCGVDRVIMMLAGPTLRVVPLTIHVALRTVPTLLTLEEVWRGLELTVTAMRRDFGLERPRVALAALNPHAGEAGLMGDEEERVLRPGLERARQELERAGEPADLEGPLPADGLFAHYQRYDAVACCYHDQAMIPIKILHRDDGVNVTLGLPIVRTSPAHGSALDIAGRGVARPDSMQAALRLAGEMAARRGLRR